MRNQSDSLYNHFQKRVDHLHKIDHLEYKDYGVDHHIEADPYLHKHMLHLVNRNPINHQFHQYTGEH